ncbi:MAG: carbamoyltransferase HypF [Anaerolineae bacterium]|nr:carbamoyltransferase HypF [Anaerolineae bacterium]
MTGVVQGVGFRPFVYGLALRHHLTGLVGNDSSGVFIEIEGSAAAVAAFQQALTAEAPPLAHIEQVTAAALQARGDETFVIVASEVQAGAATLISPDLCICDDCLRELFDPADRRYRYPFINCTNCGPRFTIIRDIPYDRPQTTMAAFPLCDRCAAEYHDPLNRRFHAQPNACPDCGPQVMYQEIASRGGSQTLPYNPIQGEDAIQTARDALLNGRILAVKGLGGFHLACDATNAAVVGRLRERKGRQAKPFAVMVYDLDTARELAEINAEETALLTSRERPIVLVRKRGDSRLAENVAPGNPYIGLMLPYTPLHYLLLHELGRPLVMTSGNLTTEPIVTRNEDALERLAPLVDAFLLHNREIHVPCDDSVVRVLAGEEIPMRRSRGYAPFPVKLPFTVSPLLAVGGELKNTFCLTRDNYAFMSQHIGDMENLETLTAFEAAFAHMQALFRIQPERIVCDLHPGYLSTRWAEDYTRRHSLPLIRVQHHHAHIAAVMAEHRLDGSQPVIGISFDGTGYGTDGAVWGGEVLVADYAGFERAAHLAYVPLAGGDASVRKPYRMALAYLHAAGIPWDDDLPPVMACPETERRILRQQFTKGLHTVPTSSMGRLFDAVSALIGLREEISYEAQAAMELEGIAAAVDETPYHFDLSGGVINPAPLLHHLVADIRAGVSRPVMSGRFHRAVAQMTAAVAQQVRQDTGLTTVALSGGVFQNVTLLDLSEQFLREAGFTVLIHRQVPANDGGLALGQAMIGQHAISTV